VKMGLRIGRGLVKPSGKFDYASSQEKAIAREI
jgi:hypothetical protein